ncbi:hypothetical protein K9M74_00450 [Candidatus Woesearchaeota archaeon]|nr:hypothetical protein [Candidatus Woesearchaeota archaeon]
MLPPIDFIQLLNELSPLQIQQRFTLEKNLLTPPSCFTYITLFETELPRPLGVMELFYFSFQKNICWQDVLPLDNARFLTYDTSRLYTSNHEPKSFGLGTLAHVKTLLKAVQEDSSVLETTIESSKQVSLERIGHLAAMGLTTQPTPFRNYLEKSINYANSKGFLF